MGKAQSHTLTGLLGQGKGHSLCEQVQGLRDSPTPDFPRSRLDQCQEHGGRPGWSGLSDSPLAPAVRDICLL